MRDYAFGKRLADIRRECGYSQFQLARLLGVSDKAVSKWETGAAKPRMKTCQKLADVLSVDPAVFFSQEEHNSSGRECAMNKKELWKAAEERLYSVYGEKPDLAVMNRFKMEKNYLQPTDAIVLFAALARVRKIADRYHARMNIRGMINSSLTAWLMGGTYFNPLRPHTRCPECDRVCFYRNMLDGFDMPDIRCSCGCSMICDGHHLPFDAFLDNVKPNFNSIECNIPDYMVSEAWSEILAFIQDGYRCDRYVYRQKEETGFPGEFSRLFLYNGNNSIKYQSIDEVPEISFEMMKRSTSRSPSIILLYKETNRYFTGSAA